MINSSPLNVFTSLCGKKHDDIFTYNQVLVLNIGFDLPSIDKEVSWVYFPGDEFFYRVGFYNNIAGSRRLSVYVEIGYGFDDNIDVEYALERTLQDLKRVNIINEHKVVAYNSYIVNPGYVHITEKAKKFKESFIQQMEDKNVYMLGRYSRWEYSAMDDSFEQSFELSKKI